MRFTIKNFGRNRGFNTKEELVKELQTKYKGNHVAVLVKDQSRMKKCVFVSVDEKGEIIDTYSGKQPQF